ATTGHLPESVCRAGPGRGGARARRAARDAEERAQPAHALARVARPLGEDRLREVHPGADLHAAPRRARLLSESAVRDRRLGHRAGERAGAARVLLDQRAHGETEAAPPPALRRDRLPPPPARQLRGTPAPGFSARPP